MKSIAWLFLLLCICLIAQAQKLPNIQSAGVYAPANVKIDGKTTEWNNQFQAYNNNANLFYTLANDAGNLVLVVQTTDRTTIEKIMRNKLSFIIAGKNGSLTLKTPGVTTQTNKDVNRAMARKEAITDSLLTALNKGLTTSYKEMEVTGLAGVTEPKIPVYNDLGIMVAARVDMAKAFTCELAIPLKYLSPYLSADGSFNYNIKVNGIKLGGMIDTNGNKMELSNADMATSTLAGFPMLDMVATYEIVGTYKLIMK